MKENLIIIHGGGPTAVLNCSLYGAIPVSYTHLDVYKRQLQGVRR